MIILGLDIGGANTKAALVHFRDSVIIKSFSYIEYFPFWEKTLAEIPDMLKRIIENLIVRNNYTLIRIDYITVTITAELSDAFQTKKEGISYDRAEDWIGKLFAETCDTIRGACRVK